MIRHVPLPVTLVLAPILLSKYCCQSGHAPELNLRAHICVSIFESSLLEYRCDSLSRKSTIIAEPPGKCTVHSRYPKKRVDALSVAMRGTKQKGILICKFAYRLKDIFSLVSQRNSAEASLDHR